MTAPRVATPRSATRSSAHVSASAPDRSVYRRRRLVAACGFLAFVLGLTVLFGSSGAQAELEDPVAGHVVVAPGETLWDVAATSAPAGVTTQDQLEAIRTLNGFTGADVPAWTVVLLPAR